MQEGKKGYHDIPTRSDSISSSNDSARGEDPPRSEESHQRFENLVQINPRRSNLYVDSPSQSNISMYSSSSMARSIHDSRKRDTIDSINSSEIHVPRSGALRRKQSMIGYCTLCSTFLCALVCILAMVWLSGTIELNSSPAPTSFEQIMMHAVNASGMNETFQHYLQKPRIAGTPEDYEFVQYLKTQAISFGIPESLIQIQEDQVILNTPQKIQFGDHQLDLAVFHPYSKSGKVTGSIIYANYGHLRDYQVCTSLHVRFMVATELITRSCLIDRSKSHRSLD